MQPAALPPTRHCHPPNQQLVNVPPNVAAHEVVKAIKGRSSRYLRQEFPHLLKLPAVDTKYECVYCW